MSKNGLAGRAAINLLLFDYLSLQQRHRVECKDISQHDTVILELDDASTFPKQLAIDNRLPTFEIMNESLRRWVKFYDFVLMAATIHALDLPKDISRATTHALWLTLHHKGTPLSPPSKNFRIDDANVVAVSDIALLREGEWSETLQLFSAMRDRSRAAEQGEVAMVIIECLPLGIQIVPVGSVLEGHLKGQVLLDWKDILIRSVENGEKVVQFGSDGCQGEGFGE